VSDARVDVAIVGAGLSGLVAARSLTAAGRSVRLVDKGRSVGGRLATRRIGDATLDHGAQFFTVRSPEFAALVAGATEAGVVYEWCQGFDAEGDGYPRHACHGGMNALAKWLAVGLDITTACQIASVAPAVGGQGWTLAMAGGGGFAADALVLTAPVPQSLTLVDAGGVELESGVRADLESIEYFATIALLVTLDGVPAVPEPGGVQLPETEPFTFVADNRRKGISAAQAMTLHANHDYSAARYDDDPDEVRAELLAFAAPWLGDAAVVEAQLKKWRYAGPVQPLPAECVATTVAGAPLVFAGDAFGGPKVEGAARSGMAAAAALIG
jgi:predicted NAD/FAD-dependent oxidoreductase